MLTSLAFCHAGAVTKDLPSCIEMHSQSIGQASRLVPRFVLELYFWPRYILRSNSGGAPQTKPSQATLRTKVIAEKLIAVLQSILTALFGLVALS